MIYIGIDIGSTATKVAARGDREFRFVLPTGWNCRETAGTVRNRLAGMDVNVDTPEVIVAATGYGRASVDYADSVVTEITCHGRGGYCLAAGDCTIIDVGGQDTKVIDVKNGAVTDFLMNDKCSAGTGKFLEIMANRLSVTIDELFELAGVGEVIPISAMCTVFAESEIVGLMGEGRKKEDIAAGIVDSVASRVFALCQRIEPYDRIVVTGGLSDSEYFASALSKKLKRKVEPQALGRYAGALGASLLAEKARA